MWLDVPTMSHKQHSEKSTGDTWDKKKKKKRRWWLRLHPTAANDQMPKDAFLLSEIEKEFLDWLHIEFMVGFLGKPQWGAELCAINSSCSCPGGQQICLSSCYKCTLLACGWGLVSLGVSPEMSKAAQETCILVTDHQAPVLPRAHLWDITT